MQPDEAGASANVPGRQLVQMEFPEPGAEVPLGQERHTDALFQGLAYPVWHGVHFPSFSVEPKNNGGPEFDEALLKPRPGAHEALVMGAQSPAVEIRYAPASHWLIQQRPSLTKKSGEEQGTDVVAGVESRPHPKELQANTATL
jgi:hypothetical protein